MGRHINREIIIDSITISRKNKLRAEENFTRCRKFYIDSVHNILPDSKKFNQKKLVIINKRKKCIIETTKQLSESKSININ